MVEIIALQEYTDQYISLYEGEIRNLPNDIALRLINKGVAAQHDKDILNSTTTQDNGKVLTVVNGKPAFSAPATASGGNSTINYAIYYSKQEEIQSPTQEGEYIDIKFLYKDKQFTTYLMPEEITQAFEEKDFIIIKYKYLNQNQQFWINIFVTHYETNDFGFIYVSDSTNMYFYPYFEHNENDPSQQK